MARVRIRKGSFGSPEVFRNENREACLFKLPCDFNLLYEFAIKNAMLLPVVIASAAKQSRFGGRRDCFVVSLLAMTGEIDVTKIIANLYNTLENFCSLPVSK